MTEVILESKKIKSVMVPLFPLYLDEVMGLDAMILVFFF